LEIICIQVQVHESHLSVVAVFFISFLVKNAYPVELWSLEMPAMLDIV